jgi:hypothetical protein
LLPAAAQGPVEMDKTLVFVATRLGEGEFGGVERALAVEDFEVCGGAALIAHVGEAVDS